MEQFDFFNTLKSKITDKNNFAKQVANSLNLSIPSTYRRLTGASDLSFKEIMTLCDTFDISFDQIVHAKGKDKNAYPFYSESLKFAPDSLYHYWSNMLSHMEQIKHLPGLSAIFLCNEMPFFYFLQYSNLLYFKTFVWDHTSWHIMPYNKSYDKKLFQKDQNLKVITTELSKFYNTNSTIELWNPDMFRLTMMQLTYFVNARLFDNAEDIMDILNDIEKLINHMMIVCETGTKRNPRNNQSLSPVSIYLNELSINSEIIYITADKLKLVYNKYDAPNYIRSNDDRVCDHMENWLEELINKSTLISKGGQRDRDRFFKTLQVDFNQFTKKIEGLISVYY